MSSGIRDTHSKAKVKDRCNERIARRLRQIKNEITCEDQEVKGQVTNLMKPRLKMRCVQMVVPSSNLANFELLKYHDVEKLRS